MGYSHTQEGGLYWLGLLGTAGFVTLAFVISEPTIIRYTMMAAGAVFLLLAVTFVTLTVEDEEDALRLRYGPVPLFQKRIPYAKMTAVEEGRTALIDGWGIHWVPGRGWTYNLWGFSCVIISLGSKTIRVGSDDTANLVRFLESKISRKP